MASIVFTGAKPTGDFHLGNYFGFIKPALEASKNSDISYLFIADLHALISNQKKEDVTDGIFHIAAAYLAAGLDPQKTIMFKQSDVPAHTELAWVFDCITTMPYLMRAHAFKDAEAKNKEISVGLFNYPMLMAADILLYDASSVPVGADQKQHVEYARDTAEKFNRIYGETFILPEAKIVEGVGVVPGTDGQKMSKSYKNTISLFGDSEKIKKEVMSIVTDSKGESEPKDPDTCNIFKLHKLVSTEEELDDLSSKYKEGGISYKDSKELLFERIERIRLPMQEKYDHYMSNKNEILEILKVGGVKAKEVAQKKIEAVREKIGVKLY